MSKISGSEGDEHDEDDRSEEYVSEEDIDKKDAVEGTLSSPPRKLKSSRKI